MESEGFRRDFLWGAATSSHQVEGYNRNDWTEWEESAERLEELAKRGDDPAGYISGRACDHYHRFREDFDLAKMLGHNAHRFSLEWSRIEPEEGKFDEQEIEHYREVLTALRERGLEPFVTLWHWTMPRWVRDQGRWENEKTIADFGQYVERVVSEYKDLVTFWMPLNEPSTYIGLAYMYGRFPPQARSLGRSNMVFNNLVRANREAYGIIHEKQPSAQVGVGNYLIYQDAHNRNFLNLPAVWFLNYMRNGRFLNALNDSQDFIGVQYYHHDAVAFTPGRGQYGLVTIEHENAWVSDNGWEIYPEGLYRLLKKVARFGKPIYVTENGIADSRDIHRAKFIQEHIVAMRKAMDEGVDVRGYFYWSLMDNFEWDSGFGPRFGLLEVDYDTLERRIRPSALEYKKIIEESKN